MTLKKMVYINTLIAFILSYLIHFAYSWFENPVSAIFFPVNESIWEHMKMLYTTMLISGVIEYILLKKYKIVINNFLITTVLKSIIIIPIYLIIYLPLYFIFKENFFIAIFIMLISIFIVNFFSCKLLDTYEIKYQKFMAILLILISYIIMGILTFNPPRNFLFLDTQDNIYGIKK